MNAVAAVYSTADSHGTRALVKIMLDRMPARGAGHRIVVAEGPAVLGAAGRSPAFGNKPDRAMLAGDLQLANRVELRATFGLPADAPDAVIALEAFCRWGVDAGRHLSGPAAFVILDRSESRLIAATDALGIRPLYYRLGTAHVRVASELQALVEEGDVPDEGFLAEALAGHIIDRAGTPYASIRRIPAAHALIVGASGTTLHKYWEPSHDPLQDLPEERGERFRLLFERAVEGSCEGHAAVGVHLDGSVHAASLLEAVKAGAHAEPIPVSIHALDPESGDAALAVDPPANDLSSIRRWLDLPDLPTGLPLLRRMCEPLKERGITVLLSARGSDLWPRDKSPEPHGWGASLTKVPQRVRRMLQAFTPSQLPDWIDPRFAKRVNLIERMERQARLARGSHGRWDDLRQHLHSAGEALGRDRADRLSVETGIEVRHPYCDRRLVEMAFATAATAGGGTNAPVAEVVAEPAGRLLVDALTAPDVEALMRFARLTELGWIQREALARLHQRALDGNVDAAEALWNVLGVEAWLEQVFDDATGRDRE